MIMKLKMLLFIGALFLSGCSKSDQDNETYLLEKAQHQINTFNFSGALNTLSKLNQEKPYVITLTASALAGRAGFNTLALVDLLTTYSEKSSVDLLLSLNSNYSSQDLADIYRATELLYSQNDLQSRIQYASLQVYKVSQLILKNYINQDKIKLCSKESILAANEAIDIIISLNLSIVKLKEVVSNIYNYTQQLQRDLGINPEKLNQVQITDDDVVSLRTILAQQIRNSLNLTVDFCEYN